MYKDEMVIVSEQHRMFLLVFLKCGKRLPKTFKCLIKGNYCSLLLLQKWWKVQLVTVSHTCVTAFRTVHNKILTFCQSFEECLISSIFCSGNHPFTKLNSFDHFLQHLFVILVSAYCYDGILKQKSKLINLIHPIFFMLTKTNPFFILHISFM